jgi:gliding motility-associated-like protein
MKRLLIFTIAFIFSQYLFAQPINDNCVDAELLCAGLITVGNNTDATLESCPANLGGCADDFPNFGLISTSSVWYKFTTNALGGNVSIDISNIAFNPDPNKGQALQAMLFTVPIPCQGQDFNIASNVVTNGTADFSLTSFVLTANTTYYLIVDGAITGGSTEPADAAFEIEISGTALDATALPTATITAINTVICQGDPEPINITITDCLDTVKMEWYYNNSYINDSTEFNTGQLSVDGYLKLIIECGTVCIYRDTTDSIFFEITPIEIDAGEDLNIELGESVILNGSGTSNPVWTPETYLSTTQSFTPTSTPAETTTYFLTVTNGTCVLTDEMTVKINEIIIVPSGFTPNNDNTNDIWEITNISQYPNNIVKIYDRSGQIVFKTTGYTIVDNNWDGTFNGKELPTSTYFYVIDLNTGGEDSVFKGSVTIIR